MPARLAETDAAKQISELLGSGPFRFRADERLPGSCVVYEKAAFYLLRNEPASRTAGCKVVHIERVGWAVIPDTPMASNAGMENLTSPGNSDGVKKELETVGYRGEKVVQFNPTDIPRVRALAEVSNDLLKSTFRMNVDFQTVDGATVVQNLSRTARSCISRASPSREVRPNRRQSAGSTPGRPVSASIFKNGK